MKEILVAVAGIALLVISWPIAVGLAGVVIVVQLWGVIWKALRPIVFGKNPYE